ncbi:MAG: lysylphosphatidylglycerol synthase domain-containing protein [Sphingomonas sp.]|jgi:putative membrane protein|uniref:lysylphosphatidylglycerol synthase domain-containing protein n=1 Tax=Sphingomonas sp. TaxID=28214 RepID=UPI0035686FE7
MKHYARAGLLAATLAGIAIAAWAIGAVGLREILDAMGAIGWFGMFVFTATSLGVLLILGLAWFAVAPGEPLSRAWLFVWARTTREAATDVLPFSQVGGLVVGARTLTAAGVPDKVVYASMVADLTTEMAAQLLFTLGGVATLLMVLAHRPVEHDIVPLALAGVAGMVAIIIAFVVAQRPLLRLAGKLGARILPGSVAAMAAVRGQLDAVYRAPRRMIAAFLLNLLAWLASAATAWVALRFMGSEVPLWAVIAQEALIFTLRSVAFAIPGAIGVQEATYALLGPLFGIPPATALALSLLKRARDLLIGIPALILWQAGEGRALARRLRTAT